MNHLHPNDPDKKDTLEEHVFCNRIFARALSYLLKEEDKKSEGVVVVQDGQKFLVHTEKNQIKISTFEDNVPEGTLVWFHRENIEDIVESESFKQFCIDNALDAQSERAVDEYLHSKWLHEAHERGDSEESIKKISDELKLSMEMKYGKSELDV